MHSQTNTTQDHTCRQKQTSDSKPVLTLAAPTQIRSQQLNIPLTLSRYPRPPGGLAPIPGGHSLALTSHLEEPLPSKYQNETLVCLPTSST